MWLNMIEQKRNQQLLHHRRWEPTSFEVLLGTLGFCMMKIYQIDTWLPVSNMCFWFSYAHIHHFTTFQHQGALCSGSAISGPLWWAWPVSLGRGSGLAKHPAGAAEGVDWKMGRNMDGFFLGTWLSHLGLKWPKVVSPFLEKMWYNQYNPPVITI